MNERTTDQTIADLRSQLDNPVCHGCGNTTYEAHREDSKWIGMRHPWQPISISHSQLRQLLDRIDELTYEDAQR